MLLNRFGGIEPEQLGTLANLQHLFEMRQRAEHIGLVRLEIRIGQQRLNNRPFVFVVAGERQTDSPVIGLVGEVEGIEPIAGIVAIAIE